MLYLCIESQTIRKHKNMAIKCEIRTIENADGNGGRHEYVRLIQPNMMTAEQLGRDIENSCTLTQADINGMMAALRHIMIRELSYGNRVYLPSIGFFRLSAQISKSDDDAKQKLTGSDIRLKGIVFRPERSIVDEIRQRIRFSVKSESRLSAQFDETELWSKVEAYIQQNRHITTNEMSRLCGMSMYMARKWLTAFTEQGRLLKSGTRHLAVYYLITY